MNRRALIPAAAVAVALTAAGCGRSQPVDVQAPPAHVAARAVTTGGGSTVYSLTVDTGDGRAHPIKVDGAVYRACSVGDPFPRCAQEATS